jgi:hypothetical protein
MRFEEGAQLRSEYAGNALVINTKLGVASAPSDWTLTISTASPIQGLGPPRALGRGHSIDLNRQEMDA